MKKLVALIMCLVVSFAVVGCGGDSGSEKTPSAPSNTSSLVSTTGSISAEVLSARLVKDTKGLDAVLVKIKYENGTSKKQNFKFSVNCQAKQGDTTLTAAVVPPTDTYVPQLITQNIEPGASLEIECSFLLKDTTTPIDVTCKPLAGEKKEAISKQLPLA